MDEELRDDIVAVMNECEPYTARDIADILDEGRRTIHNYLEALEESGVVNRKKHATQRVTWWINSD